LLLFSFQVQRREVTLVDGCGKTVGLTLWGDLATSHEADEMESRHLDRCVVLQCTSCRVTEYNGCSLSTLSKSVLTIDPEPSSADPSDPVAGLKSW
jgi:replication factor A1